MENFTKVFAVLFLVYFVVALGLGANSAAAVSVKPYVTSYTQGPAECGLYSDSVVAIVQAHAAGQSKIQVFKRMSQGRNTFEKAQLFSLIGSVYSRSGYLHMDPTEIKNDAFATCINQSHW